MSGFTQLEIDAFLAPIRNRITYLGPGKTIASPIAEAIYKHLKEALLYFYNGKMTTGFGESAAKTSALVSANSLADQCISQKKSVQYKELSASEVYASNASAANTIAAMTNADGQKRTNTNTGTLPGDFDEQIYLANNPDIAEAVKKGSFPSGANHFINFGYNENRIYSAATLAAKTVSVAVQAQPVKSILDVSPTVQAQPVKSLVDMSKVSTTPVLVSTGVKTDAVTPVQETGKNNVFYWLAGGAVLLIALSRKKKKGY